MTFASSEPARPTAEPAASTLAAPTDAVITAAPGTLLLELRGIRKVFGPTRALDGVDFDVRAGEVHGLLGQNGSGKSTLMKVAYGEVSPDEGEVLIDGHHQRIRTPREALRLGITAVAQEVPLALDLSVAENITLGKMPRSGPLIQRGAIHEQAEALLVRLGSRLDPRSYVRSLQPHERQTVAIARALARGVRIIIFDEPTSSLSTPQADRLFTVMNRLKDHGIAMVFITQRLKEIAEVADRVTVLRDGRTVGELRMSDASPEQLAELVTGHVLDTIRVSERPTRPEALLEVSGLAHNTMFQDIDLEVAAGEIVGVSGLLGCGRSELFRSIFGASHPAAGRISMSGRPLAASSPTRSINAGMALVTGDRGGEGLVLARSVQENLMMARRRKLSVKKIDFKGDRKLATELVRELRIRTPSLGIAVGSLSGGNQQKVVLGKWLAMQPKLLILDEPTRGIDVAAKADFYRAVARLADAGLGVLIGSLDDQELLDVCHRIVVMHQGRIVADLDAAMTNEDELVRHASGLGAQ